MDKGIQELIKRALREDIRSGDVTSNLLFDENFTVKAVLTAKQEGVLCGIDIFKKVFLQLSPDFRFMFRFKDGDSIRSKDLIAEITGPVRETFAGERTALNFLQHLSGVATLTRQFVERAGSIKVYDTRKTTPLMRSLEKYAVKTGGAKNHRFGLYDMVLIKDNHISAYMQREKIKNRAEAINLVVRRVVEKAKGRYKIEVEVEDFLQAQAGFLAGADIIMFDNADVKELQRFINLLGKKRRAIVIEWSGNVDLKSIERIKKLPVDRVSVGSLTHSANALDFSLIVGVRS